ncbi:helix-turn-helix domain-containing protein [Planococcus beigongshangi]|uniref:helix-turn-helix domain-containing protein n=1 Tax=Planococcus beigongshangi TaxID=2782536 RepID=UPI00193B3AA2|nr:helix-turn-helix transcriptional regulator [Planococcus beigongshangi]
MLSDRLKNLRTRRNITQSDLAKRIGVARTTYAMYEQGQREPDYETLQRLADFYEVSVDYLLGRTETPNATNVDDQADKSHFISKIASEFPDIDLMFKDMESLSAEDMKEVYDYIKFKKSQKKEE